MNRLLDHIEKRRAQLAAGVKPDGTPITGDLVTVERGLDNTFAEVVAYQELKSWAQVSGLISTDEAMTVYVALGGDVPGPNGWSPESDLATKTVITSFMGELVGLKLRAGGVVVGRRGR
jgi:hypothetical protein